MNSIERARERERFGSWQRERMEGREEVIELLRRFCVASEDGGGGRRIDVSAMLREEEALKEEIARLRWRMKRRAQRRASERGVPAAVAGQMEKRGVVMVRPPKGKEKCPLRCQERCRRRRKKAEVATVVSQFEVPAELSPEGLLSTALRPEMRELERRFAQSLGLRRRKRR